MAELKFNAADVEPTQFDVIPAGRYEAIIIDSEMRPNAAATGNYLFLTFQIVGGPYKGRQLFERLNLDNPSDTAVKIARAKLSAICRAVGVMVPKDSLELHGLPLSLPVRVKTREDNGEPGNEVGVCMPLMRGQTATQDSVGRPAPTQATTRAPW